MQFQKPENALRRAQELHEVGNTEDALAMCAQVMSNRKWKNQSALGAMELVGLMGESDFGMSMGEFGSYGGIWRLWGNFTENLLRNLGDARRFFPESGRM